MSGYEPSGSDGGGTSSIAGQAQEKVQETAQQASSAVGKALSEQVESRSAQVASELHSLSMAMRRSSHSLRADGNEQSAKILDAATDRFQSLGGYLSESSADRMLHDVEAFGRRRPWGMVGVGLGLGLVASRFLKASSRNRFETASRPMPAYPSGPGFTSPVAPPPTVPPVASVPQGATQTTGGSPVTAR